MGARRHLRVLAAVAGMGLFGVLSTQSALASATDITPPAPFDLVADAGDFQTGYAIASPWTSVSASWLLTTDESSAVSYEMAVDGVLQRVVEPSGDYATMSKRVDVPDGVHTISITAVDASGNRQPANQALAVVVDKYSPTFTSFPLLLLRKGPVSLDSVPVRYTWTAADVGTGLQRVRIGYGPTCCTDVRVDATHYDFTVPTLSTRNWRVFLYDGVGRREKVTRQVVVQPLANNAITTTGSWDNQRIAGALGGSERVSSKVGSSAKFTVTGRSVSWVTTVGPKRGVGDVYVDGRLKASIDLYAPTVQASQAVWAYKLPLGSSHRIQIVNDSSAAHDTVGLDAILVQA